MNRKRTQSQIKDTSNEDKNKIKLNTKKQKVERILTESVEANQLTTQVEKKHEASSNSPVHLLSPNWLQLKVILLYYISN
jgi:hypothetical protein